MSHDSISPEDISEAFRRYMSETRHLGELAAPSGVAELSGACGDTIGLQIEVRDGVLSRITAQPKGCVYTLVCANAVSALATGMTIDQALLLEPEDVARELGGLPDDHMHCARLAVNTLIEAIADQLTAGRPGQPIE
jgi:nitrogen fixation NifU-like protein